MSVVLRKSVHMDVLLNLLNRFHIAVLQVLCCLHRSAFLFF